MATATTKKTKKPTVKATKVGPKTYFPSKTFDDDLVALVNLFKQKGWSFSGIDGAQLGKDATDQRTERADFDAAEQAFEAQKRTFGLNQEQRFQRFQAALDAARGAFRRDKAIMAQLDKFKRASGSRKKTANGKATAPAA